MCVGFPSPPIPSESILNSFSSESIFKVILFCAGPGLYFDFAGFIFQVPECISPARAATLRARVTSTSVVAKTPNFFIRIIHSPWWILRNGPVCDVMDENSQKVQRILILLGFIEPALLIRLELVVMRVSSWDRTLGWRDPR